MTSYTEGVDGTWLPGPMAGIVSLCVVEADAKTNYRGVSRAQPLGGQPCVVMLLLDLNAREFECLAVRTVHTTSKHLLSEPCRLGTSMVGAWGYGPRSFQSEIERGR